MVSTKALESDIEYPLQSNALSAKSILGGRVALTLGLVVLQKTDLHERLGVVPSPLLEILPLFESMKARE